VKHEVRSWTLIYQFQYVAEQDPPSDCCQNPKSDSPLIRHEEIDNYYANDDAEYGITAQGGDVPSHLFNPRRTDWVGQVIGFVEKEKNSLIETCRAAL
jgi:hypothetical protein